MSSTVEDSEKRMLKPNLSSPAGVVNPLYNSANSSNVLSAGSLGLSSYGSGLMSLAVAGSNGPEQRPFGNLVVQNNLYFKNAEQLLISSESAFIREYLSDPVSLRT